MHLFAMDSPGFGTDQCYGDQVDQCDPCSLYVSNQLYIGVVMPIDIMQCFDIPPLISVAYGILNPLTTTGEFQN